MSVRQFTDAELLVIHWQTSVLTHPATRVVDELPKKNLLEQLPLVLVTRAPGYETQIESRPYIDLEAYAANRAGMWALAGRAHDAMAALRGRVVDGLLVDDVTTVADPSRRFYSDTVERSVATYQLVYRVA